MIWFGSTFFGATNSTSCCLAVSPTIRLTIKGQSLSGIHSSSISGIQLLSISTRPLNRVFYSNASIQNSRQSLLSGSMKWVGTTSLLNTTTGQLSNKPESTEAKSRQWCWRSSMHSMVWLAGIIRVGGCLWGLNTKWSILTHQRLSLGGSKLEMFAQLHSSLSVRPEN